MSPLARTGFIIAAVSVALDQASKWYFLKIVGLPEIGQIQVLPFFNFTMVWNQGVSFGLLGSGSMLARVGLVIFALIVSGLVARYLLKADRRLPAMAYGLVIGGAIGNMIDRIFHGRVFDFLDFSGLGFPWVFNIADSAISIGVALLVWDAFFAKQNETPQ